MKLTKAQLRKIIKEELNAAMAENIDAYGMPMALEDDALYYIVRVSDKKYLMNDQSSSYPTSLPNIEEPDFEHVSHDRNRNPRSEHVWKGDHSMAASIIRHYEIVHHYPTGKPWKDRVQLRMVKQNKTKE
jgi:hypothetical protein